MRDHLGNTRVMFMATENGPVVSQTADYYRFGLSHHHNNPDKNKYLYNGKEMQDNRKSEWYEQRKIFI